MRIEAYTQVQQIYNAHKTNKAQKASNACFSDQLELSSMGKDMQVAKQAVQNSPDVREDLVAKYKAQIQDGTYQVSSESFADKLIRHMEEA